MPDYNIQPVGEEEVPFFTNRPELKRKKGVTFRKDIPPIPKDEDLEVFDRWQNFRKEVINTRFGGVDPDTIDPVQEAQKAKEKYLNNAINKYGRYVKPEIAKMILTNAAAFEKNMLGQQKEKVKGVKTEIENMRKWFEADERKRVQIEGTLKLYEQREKDKEELLQKKYELAREYEKPKRNLYFYPKGHPWAGKTAGVYNEAHPVDMRTIRDYGLVKKEPKITEDEDYDKEVEQQKTKLKPIPANAQTGTYKGIRAYTTDGVTFFDMSGNRLK